MISRVVSFLVILVCTAMPLEASSTPRVLAWDDEVAARKLALVSGESAVEITDMHPSKRTGPLKVKRSGPLFVRALDRDPGEDGQPVQVACRIPESVTRPLIVLLPDETHATGLRTLVVDDNTNGFSFGTFRFLNATPKDIIVQLEQRAVRVPAGWKPTDLRLGGDTRGIGARIALAESIERPIYSAVWEYDKDVRTLCFIVPNDDPRLSPVAFKAIPEDRILLELEARAERER